MATHAQIGLLRPDGTIKGIFVWYNGYPGFTGRILKDDYKDKNKINQLLDLGALLVLGRKTKLNSKGANHPDAEDLECEFCVPMKNAEGAAIFESEEDFLDDRIDYNYLFKDGEWLVSEFDRGFEHLSGVVSEALTEKKVELDVYDFDQEEYFTPDEQEEYGIDEHGEEIDGYETWHHCGWCGEPFPESGLKKEIQFGWLCDHCAGALWSRGEKLALIESADKETNKDFAEAIVLIVERYIKNLGGENYDEWAEVRLVSDMKKLYNRFFEETKEHGLITQFIDEIMTDPEGVLKLYKAVLNEGLETGDEVTEAVCFIPMTEEGRWAREITPESLKEHRGFIEVDGHRVTSFEEFWPDLEMGERYPEAANHEVVMVGRTPYIKVTGSLIKGDDYGILYGDMVENGDGHKQTNIRGNHVALCEQGRAGIARLADSVNDTSSNGLAKLLSSKGIHYYSVYETNYEDFMTAEFDDKDEAKKAEELLKTKYKIDVVKKLDKVRIQVHVPHKFKLKVQKSGGGSIYETKEYASVNEAVKELLAYFKRHPDMQGFIITYRDGEVYHSGAGGDIQVWMKHFGSKYDSIEVDDGSIGDADSAALGLDVLVPDEDHDELDNELIVRESLKEDNIPLIKARLADVEYNDDDNTDCHVLMLIGDLSEDKVIDMLAEAGQIDIEVNDIFEKEIKPTRPNGVAWEVGDVIEVLETEENNEPEYLSDEVTQILDDYGILYGDIVENGDGSVNVVGVDDSEWQEVVDAIKDELGLDVIVPPADHEEFDDELIIKESFDNKINKDDVDSVDDLYGGKFFIVHMKDGSTKKSKINPLTESIKDLTTVVKDSYKHMGDIGKENPNLDDILDDIIHNYEGYEDEDSSPEKIAAFTSAVKQELNSLGLPYVEPEEESLKEAAKTPKIIVKTEYWSNEYDTVEDAIKDIENSYINCADEEIAENVFHALLNDLEDDEEAYEVDENGNHVYMRTYESLKEKVITKIKLTAHNNDGETLPFLAAYDLPDDGSGYGPFAFYINLLNKPVRPANWEDFEFGDEYVLDSDGDDYSESPYEYYTFKDCSISKEEKQHFVDMYNNFEDADLKEKIEKQPDTIYNESLTESSWLIKEVELKDGSRLSVVWEKEQGYYVRCVHEPYKDHDGATVWKTKFADHYNNEKDAIKAFDEIVKKDAGEVVEEKTESLKEANMSGSWVMLNPEEVDGLPTIEQVQKAYKEKYGRDITVTEIDDYGYNHAFKEQEFRAFTPDIEGREAFWVVVHKDEAPLDKGKELEETVEKHDTLNPKLWNEDKTLKPEVEEKVKEIVNNFVEALKEDEIKIDVDDIILVGSNCSYNYNNQSDLDIHIVANEETFDCPEKHLAKLYSAYRSLFNNKYDINFYGIPVEIYVEPKGNPAAKSNGLYSLNNGWVREPVQENIPEIDQEEIDKEVQPWLDRADKIIENPSIEEIEQFITDIYDLRKASIANDGEYGVGNLVFKEIRGAGILNLLKELKTDIAAKNMSLGHGEGSNEEETKVDLVTSIDEDFSNMVSEMIWNTTLEKRGGTFDKKTGEDLTGSDRVKNMFAVGFKGENWETPIEEVGKDKFVRTLNELQSSKEALEADVVGTWSDDKQSSIDLTKLFSNEDDARKFAELRIQKAYGVFNEFGEYSDNIYLQD